MGVNESILAIGSAGVLDRLDFTCDSTVLQNWNRRFWCKTAYLTLDTLKWIRLLSRSSMTLHVKINKSIKCFAWTHAKKLRPIFSL